MHNGFFKSVKPEFVTITVNRRKINCGEQLTPYNITFIRLNYLTTRKGAILVSTGSINTAVVVSKSTLVDVFADETRASVSGLTFTRVASVTVGADSVGTAVVDSVAFIVIDAAGTVTVVASLAAATISSVTGH